MFAQKFGMVWCSIYSITSNWTETCISFLPGLRKTGPQPWRRWGFLRPSYGWVHPPKFRWVYLLKKMFVSNWGMDTPKSNVHHVPHSHDGSMVLVYMVTCIPYGSHQYTPFIPSIYPLYVSILYYIYIPLYTSTMDPSWGTPFRHIFKSTQRLAPLVFCLFAVEYPDCIPMR